MKIFNYEIKRNKKEEPEKRSQYVYNPDTLGTFAYGTYSNFSTSKSLTLSACYRAVNLIGDAIASLQMKPYTVDEGGFKVEDVDNVLYNILGYEPNPMISRFNFFKQIINSILLRGNAYIKIHRSKGFEVEALEFINPDIVTISNIKGDLKYMVNGQQGFINSADMIHILNYPDIDSYYGVSTLTYASNSLGISYDSEQHAKDWFLGGANVAGVASSSNQVSPKQEQDLKNKFASNANGIAFIGGISDFQFSTIGISPKDSQLLETRQFNIIEIARFFSVNPILLFDSTKGTYSNTEHAQLSFLNETLLPIIEKIENEFSRKLILPSNRSTEEIRFDLKNLLRIDTNSQADYYTKLFGLGVMNANQIAKELNLPKVSGTGGDKYFVSTNLQDSDNLIVNTDNSIDNKLKGEDETK